MTEHTTDHRRIGIVRSPTPLYRLGRMSEKLGIELSIKRDDLAGPPLGGNKARQLEYYLGAAMDVGADTVLVTGAVQSNFVRIAAAAAAPLGLKTVVQLEDRVANRDGAYRSSGNALLLRILGAELIRRSEGEDEDGADAALRSCAARLRREGRHPYVIPMSAANPPVGALGYVRAGREILEQADGFENVVVASGSGLTHIGLLAGLRAGGSKAKVIGSCVRRPADQQTVRLNTVLAGLRRLSYEAGHVEAKDIRVWDGAFAPGYGIMGADAAAAMEMLARTEGILLDPVYTAKSFAAVCALVCSGEIEKGSRTLFVHTGGLAGIFAYQRVLDAAFGAGPPQ